MSAKERADVLLALAKSANERYDHRVENNYALRLAVWTAFGVATWFILSSDKWKPGLTECLLGSLTVAGIVLVVVFIWGKNTYESTNRWSRVAYYWESAIEADLGERLPDSLHNTRGGYVHYVDGPIAGPMGPWYGSYLYVSQALITTLFGLTVIGALFSKSAQGKSSGPAFSGPLAHGSQPSHVATEQVDRPANSHGSESA